MISIITPTYNRAYILGTLYESLKQQTSDAFEWIIIDDGSADETEALVNKWKTEEKRRHSKTKNSLSKQKTPQPLTL